MSTQLEKDPEPAFDRDSVEMPRPTIAPIMLALGMTLLVGSVPLGLPFMVTGTFVTMTGLCLWVGELLPGRGHCREPFEISHRPQPVIAELDKVEQLRPGMPGYRARLPEAVHPLSAGIKGGIIGGVAMPIPALLYGVISGHGIWYPVNLLAGMVLPNIGIMTEAQLEQFSLVMFVSAIVIHAAMAVVFGLLFGVLLPMLPEVPRLRIPGPLVWGGIIFPIFWTVATRSLMGFVNPVLQARVNWPWFVLSQFVFGIVAALIVSRSEKIAVPPAGHYPD